MACSVYNIDNTFSICFVDEALIREIDPDAVILATGGTPLRIALPGIGDAAQPDRQTRQQKLHWRLSSSCKETGKLR